MIPKNEKNTDDYQIFLIDEVSWYPYFSTTLIVLGVVSLVLTVLTTDIIWLVFLITVLIALYFGQRAVEKKWKDYKIKTENPNLVPEDRCEYWKCSCGKLNPIGTGICRCGKSAAEVEQTIEEQQNGRQ